jgi:tetratricopeptide (TPR) repeat protein
LIRLRTSAFDESEENLKQAHDAIETALRLDSALPEAHHALASFYTLNWTNQAMAEKELQLAREGLPGDPDVLADLAANNLNRGRKNEAVDYIRRAAALDPENGDIANLCALILDFASLYPEAIAERERAFRVGGWPSSLTEKAIVMRNWKGDLALTLQTLELAAPSKLSDADARGRYWRTRSTFLLAQGSYAEALGALAQAGTDVVSTQFFYHTVPQLQGAILEAQGDAVAARTAYERALLLAEAYRAANPKVLRSHTSLALVYAALGRDDEARASAERCLQVVPPAENPYIASRTGLRVLCQVHARAGRMDQALEIARGQIAAGFWKRHELLLDYEWARLRGDPRFVELARAAQL